MLVTDSLERYMAYHEAGHVIAMYHSRCFDFQSLNFVKKGYFATPKERNGVRVERTPRNFLDKAVIAVAGEAAGMIFCSREGIDPENPVIQEGLYLDRISFSNAADEGRFSGNREAFIRVTRRFLRKERVWSQISIVASAIIDRCGRSRIDAHELSSALKIHGSGGRGLPKPLSVRIEVWIKSIVLSCR